jgi:hypothetical protein
VINRFATAPLDVAYKAHMTPSYNRNGIEAGAAATIACRWFGRIADSVPEPRPFVRLGNLNGVFSTLNFDF